MTDRPITIIAPVIQRVLDGGCTTLRRARGALSECRPGERLWVREQFRLPIRFDHISPLKALEQYATPVMTADVAGLPDYATCDLGRNRFAREMPKVWHRAHLVIESVRVSRLQTMTEAEAIAEGFPDLTRFAQSWDAGQRFFRRDLQWRDNPETIVLTFRCVQTPLDVHNQRAVA